MTYLFDDPADEEQLLERNTPTMEVDPTVPDTVFFYHNRGVHALYLNTWLEPVLNAITHKAADRRPSPTLKEAIQRAPRTSLDWVIDTYSKEEK